MKNRWIITMACILGSAFFAQATTITDDFSTAGDPLPGNWFQYSSTGTNFVSNGSYASIKQAKGDPNAVAWNTGLETISGGGTNFDLSVDVSVHSGGRLTGVAFNVQNATNYYFVGIVIGGSAYRFYEVVDGTGTQLFAGNASVVFSDRNKTNYTINVTSDTEGSYDFFITEKGQSTVLNSITNYTVSGTALSGGYAGLYTHGNSSEFRYDNFSLETIPEPATLGMVGLAAAGIIMMRRLRM